MKAEIAGNEFVATVEPANKESPEHRTTLHRKDSPADWSLEMGEQELKDFVGVTRMGNNMANTGELLGALALSEGKRQSDEPWTVSEGVTREYKVGRFGINVDSLWIEEERSQLTARLSDNGKPSLTVSAEDVKELHALSRAADSYVQEHLKQGLSLEKWKEQHAAKLTEEPEQQKQGQQVKQKM